MATTKNKKNKKSIHLQLAAISKRFELGGWGWGLLFQALSRSHYFFLQNPFIKNGTND
jgi:hypothetical protein